MIRKLLTIEIILLFIIFNSLSCKKNPVTPPPHQEPTDCTYPEGNRNFNWELDTIAWFPSTVAGVWAFSDSDAYVIGYIVDGKPPYTLRPGRHWNGNIWEDNVNGTWEDIGIDPRNDLTGDDHFMVAVGFWGISTTIFAGIAEFNNLTKKWKNYKLEAIGELRAVWTDGKGYFISVGDNGMVYTKDGYSSGWVYSKAPTDFNFTKVTGISKTEIYLRAVKSLATGEYFEQLWKHYNNNWIKLMDDQDTSDTPIKTDEVSDEVYSIAAYRCSITDSLYLYIVGRESFVFNAKGDQLIFSKTNLALKGLTLSSQNTSAGNIFLFSPNDYWISSLRYHLYHWNGNDFQKIESIPNLPYGQLWGSTSRIIKNNSGKIWVLLELGSQVYSVIQGTL